MNVGDVLKKILHDTWGIPTCGACHETAKKMNNLGVKNCREQIDELAEELHQNAKQQNWKSLIGAAVAFVDAASHPLIGNALYRSLIHSACDLVERQGACRHRGERLGHAPWNQSLERFACLHGEVEQRWCIADVIIRKDSERARGDDIAICKTCNFKEPIK